MTILLGFASEKVKILEKEFAELKNDSLKIATDDALMEQKAMLGC